MAQEFDFGAIAVEPICPPMAEFNRLFEGVFRGHGRNLRAGRQLPAQFEAAGSAAPDGTDAAVHFLPLAAMAAMMIGVYDGLFAAGAELGIADPTRASAFREDMMEAGEDGRYYCLTPILITAWKRIALKIAHRRSPCHALLLAGHRVGSYITAEPAGFTSRRARR